MLYQAELYSGRGWGERSCSLVERRNFGTIKALRRWAAEKLMPIIETRYNVSRALERAPRIRVSRIHKWRGHCSRRATEFIQYIEPKVHVCLSIGEQFGVNESYMR